ncbi:MAG: hypothetical protein KL787_10010 [Taibaiella sp.]|nr:hypothetical protein [Taibaiella sp.]
MEKFNAIPEPKLPYTEEKDFEYIPSVFQVIETDKRPDVRTFKIIEVEGLNKGTFRIDGLHKQYARKIGLDHILTDTNIGQCLFCLIDNQFYMNIGNMDGGAPISRRAHPMYYFAINSIGE